LIYMKLGIEAEEELQMEEALTGFEKKWDTDM
jgi:hypothetical protein